MTNAMIRALLGSQTSRRNKMALLAQCVADHEDVQWCWKGSEYESRLLVLLPGADQWRQCRSYDEDVRPLLEG